jgi:hypothetical protein
MQRRSRQRQFSRADRRQLFGRAHGHSDCDERAVAHAVHHPESSTVMMTETSGTVGSKERKVNATTALP